ncbi:acyltransferase family protein [Bacillus pinisoli]|uniref:acyltransferase family protein n=1 Tax=Bacillus pinisoli TaxID=2901866 RepID=UPI001FF1568C|nr:acyltransferase family protein [Bacillus pinisoli]
MENRQSAERYYDLDWIRVFAIILVFLFHCSMFFNTFPWHVKNNELDDQYFVALNVLLGTWIMPLFFVISGMSTFHSLKKRSGVVFIKERYIRLGIPLLLGVFFLSPPQVYIERLTLGQFKGSFLEFIPHAFDGLYLSIGGSGNLAFVGLHLWYLFLLIIFTTLLLPILLLGKHTKIENRPFNITHIIWLAIPLIILSLFVDLVNLGGWDILFYFIIFLFGYYFLVRTDFRKLLRKYGIPIGIISLLTSATYVWLFFEQQHGTIIFHSVKVVNCLSWLLFVFYLGDRFLNKDNFVLKYCSEATMPFYIIHQPVIVILGYYMINLQMNIVVKYLLLSVISFSLIISIYHFLIKPTHLLRPFFGLKSNDKTA